jgi:xanthine dehydrogenase YagR molybdenum-binding subunit
MPAETSVVGKPIDRVDGRLKVTGGAKYAADNPVQNLAHAVAVISTIARGRITGIDTSAAERLPGVLAVLTHETIGELKTVTREMRPGGQLGQAKPPLSDDIIRYGGQYIAIVVADTLEQARHASGLVKATYDQEKPSTDIDNPLELKDKGKTARGDADGALASAAVKISQTYSTPVEHHNPMEMHATVAAWDGDRLTLWDATQHVLGVRGVVAAVLGIQPENIRVIDPYMGGGFGCKGSVWPNSYLAAAAARHVNRPVKFVVTRQQMFSQTGYRPRTKQQVSLGVDADRKLVSLKHESTCTTASFEDWVENSGRVSGMLYKCENVLITQKVARINAGVPVQMRAPGEASGMFGLESAMDELAYAAKIDPIDLRLRSYADKDYSEKEPLPFTSKSLRECYQIGADKFGWSKRAPQPGQMRDGDELIGYGMATATYPAGQNGASAAIRLQPDGTVIVTTAGHDLGTGTYTICTQIAAETLGVSPDKIRVQLGDTTLPRAPGAGGSTQAVSVGSAVRAAGQELLQTCAKLLDRDANQMTGGDQLMAVFEKNGGRPVSATANSVPDPSIRGKYARYSFGAQFAEVRVNPRLGTARVTRWVGAFAAGRILNPKTARSQMIGGIIMGLGMALLEHTVYDPVRGKIVTDNLADYLVPVNADVPEIDIVFIDERDEHVNPLGAKGVGELGITGAPAAIANAVYHATGTRVRDLPIRVDDLLTKSG